MKAKLLAGCLLFSSATLAFAQAAPDAASKYRKIQDEFKRAYKAKDYPALIQANKKALEFTHGSSRWLFNLAGCYALAGQKDEAFHVLHQAAAMKLDGSDILKDEDFASLRNDPRWKQLEQSFAENRKQEGQDRVIACLKDPELLTEDIAWLGNAFYLTSVRKKVVLKKSVVSDSMVFADLPKNPGWPLFAIVADAQRGVLWVTAAAMPDFALSPKADWGRTTLLEFDLAAGGKLRHRYDLPDDGKPHVLGDAALTPNGDLIISDGLSGAIYRFRKGNFTRIDHGEFVSPQTPAISPGGLIIVPDYVRGLARLNPDSPTPVTWLAKQSLATLNGIDGLYFAPSRSSDKQSNVLFAIQNGVSPRRIVSIELDPQFGTVKSFKVLLANSPGLGEPTHGVVRPDQRFFFIANSGWDQLDDNGTVKSEVKPTPPEIRTIEIDTNVRPTLRPK